MVAATGQRFGLNMISAVSARGLRRFIVVKDKVNVPKYVEFM